MRILGLLVVLVLTIPVSGQAEAEERRAVDIDLGTQTLDHMEFALGPLKASMGFGGFLMVGTYTLPWLAALLVPDSVAPNISAKARLFSYRGVSADLSSNFFYARLGDVDGDGLNMRAVIWPIRGALAYQWPQFDGRFSTSLAFTNVHSSITGGSLFQSDTRVFGVAVARSRHLGLNQRFQVNRNLSFWSRLRVLVGHSPVVARVDTEIGEDLEVIVEARANASELSSGVALVGGIHLEVFRFAMVLGGGYGTWFLPGIYLPIGQNAPIGEVNMYFRF